MNSVGTACGESPLQLAVSSEHTHCSIVASVHTLVQEWTCRLLTKSCCTPFLMKEFDSQVYGGHVAAVKWLLSRGANVYLADRFGNSAIDIARKKSNLPYPFENFKNILDMIENHIDFRSDVSLAEAYRIEGNKLFKERNFKRAIVKYSNSLQLASDHRTYSNRSQCYLNLAKLHREIETNFQYRIKGIEFYHELYENALADAEAACAMEPRYSKSYYREAIALLGMGNFHGALETLHAGLRQCGNSDSSVSFLNNMMKNILDKLQLTKTEVDKLYGRLMPSLVADEVYAGKKEESTSNLLSSSVSSPGHSLCDFNRIPSNMCMWCEKLIPWSMMHIQQDHDTPEILDREIVGEANLPLSSFGQKGRIEHCPLCFCNFYDKISPQILRDQYLGGNTFPL